MCKEFFSQKSEITIEVQVSLGIFFVENLPKIALNQYTYFGVVYHMYSVCIYIVKSYYDLSVLSMSVIGFQKKFGWGGWLGGVSSIQVFFGIFFNFAKPLTLIISQILASGSTQLII